jgi:murein DD-endopeptidase MepM/ murein hydrolase activator NlpD
MTVRVTAPYLNPLRRAAGIVSQRIDQGVDYDADGGSPLYALGDGKVVVVYNWGWPNGVFIAYRLTDGPAQGQYVYASEDLAPDISVGQSVTSSTVIGTFVAGADGGYDIETGWADGAVLGNSMARTYGQSDGYDSTAFGQDFSRLLVSLGAPGGILKGTVNGSLPAGWPTWP